MTRASIFSILGVVALCLSASSPRTRAADVDASARCQALGTSDLSTVEDAPTQITETVTVKATGQLPGYCRVTGYVAPQVGIWMALPESWNGKLIERGCTGTCGELSEKTFSARCDELLRKGYACITSDMGHIGNGYDHLWSLNNLQASVDWGYRGPHVVALAGKAITQTFYQKPPAHSYFSGCSTAGRQALQEAQRFPWDFDGIIAGDPPIRLADFYVTLAWGQRAAHDSDGKPLLSIADLKLLTDGALARCDMDDGVRDGIISSPLTCPFRPSDIACKAGQTTACLTPEKVRAAEQIYSGPVDALGKPLFGGGALPGSELGGSWNEKWGGNWGAYLGNGTVAQEGLKLLFFSPQPLDWAIRSFDFNHDYKRLDVMESLYDSSNPDLTRFKSAGGKMFIYQGYNDPGIPPQWAVEYYKKVERVMGGREQTQPFVRLFTLPGVEHCAGGAGADTIDYLTYLEDWVEHGHAPDKLIGSHLDIERFFSTHDRKSPDIAAEWQKFLADKKSIKFTRPFYPYPAHAKYRGRGDPNDAENFYPVNPSGS